MNQSTKLLLCLLFTLGVSETVQSNDVIRISEALEVRDASRFLGAVVRFSDTNLSAHPEWLPLVQNMHLPLLRYPGGTVANFWDWQRGNLVAGGMPSRPLLAERHPDFTLKDFAELTKQCNAIPVFCLNILTDTLESQTQMLEAAEALGLAIQYVELGNELNSDHPGYRERFPDATSYGREAAIWIATLSGRFPQARFGIVAAGPHPWQERPWKAWNDAVLAQATNAHALIVHPYLQSGWVLPGVVARGGTPSEATLLRQAALLEQDEIIRSFLGLVPKRMEGYAELAAAYPDFDFWFTEFNLADRMTPAGSSWLHALILAEYILYMLEEERIEMALYHQLSGPRSYSAIYHRAWPRPWLNDHTTPFTYSPQGAVLTLFGEILKDRPRGRKLNFAPNPPWPRSPRRPHTDYPSLIGYRFDASDNSESPQWVLLNLSPTPRLLEWPESAGPVILNRVWRGHPHEPSFVQDNAPPPLERLPPYSITIWSSAPESSSPLADP